MAAKDKYTLVADLHVHTIASGHAYSTIQEIASAAAEKGLKIIGITDHGPAMPGGPHQYHFRNLQVLPRQLNGVEILRGAELNILNEDGELDLSPSYLGFLDLVWAGLHVRCFSGSDLTANTRAVLRALENPYVDGVVHPGNPDFPLDAEAVVRRAWELDKLVEINNSSFHFRLGSLEPCRHFASLVRSFGSDVAVNSDAHFAGDVGRSEMALQVLEEVGLSLEQVVNTSVEKVHRVLERRRQRLKEIT